MTPAPHTWHRCAMLAGALALPAIAQPQPLAGDAAAGRVLVERDCIACHQTRFGDAATIYTRAERKVRTPEQLLAQVRLCNAQLQTRYFPDEEEHVAAYLNAQYYRFKP